MKDDSGITPDIEQTVELSEPRDQPTAELDLRHELPGVEPDRVLDDWGRSQRVEAVLDRALGGFLYHYWFRVEAEEIANVPAQGGAVLVANHAGALPADALMVAKAIRDEHPGRRTVHLATDRTFRSVPGLGMAATKAGTVAAHPANLQRLLFDEEQLALLFPEGRRGTRKPIKERYRLRRFNSAFVDAAIRAGVPIVPLAVLGSEESMPVLGRVHPAGWLPAVGSLNRLGRLPALPLVPVVPLPTKVRIRFLEPVSTGDVEDPGRLAEQIRALIQENLLEMVAARRSVWLG